MATDRLECSQTPLNNLNYEKHLKIIGGMSDVLDKLLLVPMTVMLYTIFICVPHFKVISNDCYPCVEEWRDNTEQWDKDNPYLK